MLAVLLLLFPAARPCRAAELDESLLEVLARSRPDERIPILIVMEEQGVSPAERARLGALRGSQRRAEGRAALLGVARRSQGELDGALRLFAARGEAAPSRRMYMVNAVSVSLQARRITTLLKYSSIRKVLWDPPVPEEEMLEPLRPPVPSPQLKSMMDPAQIWWQLTHVHAPEAWALGMTGAGVLVAVVDTGTDYTHPDLASHVWTNPGEIPANGLDDDGNGFVDDVRGWNFVEHTNDPMDQSTNSHGTMAAGVVAGDGTSGISCGVAPQATILPVRAVGGSWSDLFAGIDYAVLMNADVIQLSATQKWRFNPKPDYAAWRALADNELALGIAHTNSIGNEGLNQDTDPIPFNIAAPGGCPAPWLHPDQYLRGGVSGIVAVGAISQADIAADYSSRGPSAWEDFPALYPGYPYVMPPAYQDYPWTSGLGGLTKPDLVAPGPGTLSLRKGGGYGDFSGTSAASPHVAGTMALCLQADSTLSPAQLDMVIETTAGDLGDPGKDSIYGAGLLNAGAAVEKVLNLAAYGTVSGMVYDSASGLPLPGSEVRVGSPARLYHANALGSYEVSLSAGDYPVVASAFGYASDSAVVTVTGRTVHDAALVPLPAGTLRGRVLASSGDTLSGVAVRLLGTPLSARSDSSGWFEMPGVPAGQLFTAEFVLFNYHRSTTPVLVPAEDADTVFVALQDGLVDDFESDQGWTRDPADTAPVGKWERCDPNGTWSGTTPVQPEDDASAHGTQCFITMNGNPGAGMDFSDVDAGKTTLLSPVFDGTIYTAPVLSYQRWYSNNASGHIDDVFQAQVSTDGGTNWINLETVAASAPSWVERSFNLASVVSLTTTMRLRFLASDLGQASTVEAGIDEVRINGPTVAAPARPMSGPSGLALTALPNPFAGSTSIRYRLPGAGEVRLAVYDAQGRWIRDLLRGRAPGGEGVLAWDGRDAGNRACGAGVYFARLTQGKTDSSIRMVLALPRR